MSLFAAVLVVGGTAKGWSPRNEVFGGVPEWSKGSDCKSDGSPSKVQILPPPPVFSALKRLVSIVTDSAVSPENKGFVCRVTIDHHRLSHACE